MSWLERQFERLRSFNQLVVDGVLAVIFTVVGIATAFAQDIHDADGTISEGFAEPGALVVLTAPWARGVRCAKRIG